MAIYKSNKKVVAVDKGSTPINNIYKGVTLVFQKSGGGGGSTHLFEGTATGNFDLKINNQKIPITIDADGKWFYDTEEKIISLNEAFYNQNTVTSVDLSSFDPSNLTTADSMFRGSSLVSVDLSSFDTSNLESASYLFSGCSKLVSLDLSSFNTSNLQNASYLFNVCSSLVSLDLSNWNTSNLQNVSYLFGGCTSLETLDLSNFDMSKATSYTFMFNNCKKLTHIKCKQAFKDWCASKKRYIALANYNTINWEIVA